MPVSAATMDSSPYAAATGATGSPGPRGLRRSRGSRASRRAHLSPLWPVGVPLPPPLPITPEPQLPQVQMGEPATVVGDSGKKYARINDRTDGLPEQISVQPPAGAPPNPGDGKGPGVSMAGGGIFDTLKNPWDTQPPTMNSSYNDQSMVNLRNQASNQQWGILGNQQQQLGITGRQIDAQGNQIDAQGRVLDARGGVNMAMRNQMPLDRNVLMAEQGVIGARGQQIDAQGRVISAQETELGGTRGLINLQQQQTAARYGDTMRIRNAGANVADKAAVAMESLYRGTQDHLIYDKLGVAPPPTISVPGADATNVPPGMRSELKTQEQIVSEIGQMNEQDRSHTMDVARQAVQLLGTDTEAARLAAAKVGLTVDQASLLVSQARNTAGLGQLNVDSARLNASDAELASSRVGLAGDRVNIEAKRNALAGDNLDLGLRQTNQSLADMKTSLDNSGQVLYTDPYTGKRTAMTPYEADQKRYDYETGLSRGRIPSQYETATQRQNYESNLRPLASYSSSMFQDAIEAQLAGNPLPGLTASEIINELAARPGNTREGANYQYGLMAQEAVRKANLKKAQTNASLPPVAIDTSGH